MSEPILAVQNLRKTYGDFVAVDDISFTVEPGEIFGLLGPNGAGKTTTISMLTAVLTPTSGTAVIGGYDLHQQTRQVKTVNGLVPQDLALYPTLSARANLNFFGRIYGLSGNELKQRVNEVLEIVALTDRADEPVENYSGGMKRRVNIAAGLLHKPRLLFLDEPTVGVDPQSRRHIFESVQQLNQEGMSIIYTSHYMEEVELLCNRVAIIDEGKIIALDTVKNLIATLGGGMIQVGFAEMSADFLPQIEALTAVAQATLVPPPNDDAPPTITIEASHNQQALIQLLKLCNDRDVDITALEVLEPNLESVFLHLTGKKLRE